MILSENRLGFILYGKTHIRGRLIRTAISVEIVTVEIQHCCSCSLLKKGLIVYQVKKLNETNRLSDSAAEKQLGGSC